MKRKASFILVVALVLTLFLITIVAAQNVRNVNADTTWDANADSTAVKGSDTNVVAEGSSSSCAVTRAGLLQWDVSDIADTDTVGNVTITLHQINFNVGSIDTTKLGLFEAPDNWNETTNQGGLPTPPDHAAVTPLAEVTGPFNVNGDAVFQASGTNDPLIQYIQNQITGDNVVSFWVEVTDGCPTGVGTALVAWNSREAGTSTMELSTPTSVGLATFSANVSSVNWPLIAGLFALVAVVVVGIGYGVRRSKQS